MGDEDDGKAAQAQVAGETQGDEAAAQVQVSGEGADGDDGAKARVGCTPRWTTCAARAWSNAWGSSCRWQVHGT